MNLFYKFKLEKETMHHYQDIIVNSRTKRGEKSPPGLESRSPGPNPTIKKKSSILIVTSPEPSLQRFNGF